VGEKLFQVANNTNLLVRYGLVWVSYFSKTGLLFKIETSKSHYSLISVSVVFWVSFGSHIGLFGSHFLSHQNGLFWVSHRERPKLYLNLSFGYEIALTSDS
jgi:hypothetical protein